MHRRSVVALALVGLLGATIADAQTPAKIPVGAVSKTAADWPHYVAEENGFYRAENLAPEVTYVGNVANTVQQTVGGSYVTASSTFDTAVRAIAKGGNVLMIGSTLIKYPYSVMVAPAIKNAADMKGKRIILPFSKDLLTIMWDRWIAEQGVPPDAVEQVYDGATPNRLAALLSGGVQAAAITQPFDFRAADQGYQKLVDLGAYAKDYGFLVIVARPEWLKDHPDQVRGYLHALARAVDWLYDPANRDAAVAILARDTGTDPTVGARTYDYYFKELQPFSRNLAIPERIVATTVQTLVEIGDIAPTDRKFTDLSFLPH
jgi:ABC-type nitrate/sulfonate/bicarbonate transport system substrate-binding protein